MIAKQGSHFDVILLTAEYYDDHPLSPAGIIARVLDAAGFSVGIIEKPLTGEDVARLGPPRLFFGVTAGSIDSMLNNYTPLKKERTADAHSSVTAMPDRAVIAYCNRIKERFRGIPIVIGGIEASLRRFAHYDYWDNAVRRSILFDSRADILVYGSGEKQVIEIAERLRDGRDLTGIEGTCRKSRELPPSFELLPSFQEVTADKIQFCRMQAGFSNRKNLAQEYENNYLLQYRSPQYTTGYLDWIYSLPYTRELHPDSLLAMARFSVVTHRGCVGRCSFCSLALHQGDRIISRSEESILAEIKRLTGYPGFKGYIDDLGGPSANMYGMDCGRTCSGWCLSCSDLDRSHQRLIALLKKARAVPGVKKVFVRSGIRYDLAMASEEYLKELSAHHISGSLKIAPEHFSPGVLTLMNKDNSRFDEFVKLFNSLNRDTRQSLRHYLMIGHPGDDEEGVKILMEKVRALQNIEQFQVFTPTPMSVSSCMYWTGVNPFTLEKVRVVRDYRTKKKMKRMLLGLREKRRSGARAVPRQGAKRSGVGQRIRGRDFPPRCK
ncbi:MAG: YgiQ family radical SAM protein [PVC group bacterium]